MEINKKGTAIVMLLVLLLTVELRAIVCADAELKLIRDLMEGYDPDVRPCEKVDESVQVTIDITLHQIIEVDAKNQVIITSIWQRLYWKDEHLTWNASKYGGLDRIRLSAERIWKPDITLINDVSGDFHGSQLDYPATVLSDGNIRWLTPRLLTSSCTMDMTYFPWDNQTCTLQFTSWTHDNSEMTLTTTNPDADSTDYVENGEWELVGLPVRKYVYSAPCCAVPFTNIEFDIQMRRRARYYVTNLIFPSVLITAAGMLVFCLPPESGEKVSLSVTILLATTVYQLLLADRMPVQSMSTPVIGRYIITTQVLLGLSTTFTVLVLDIHHQGIFGHCVPRFLQNVIKVMASVLLFKGTARKVWNTSSTDKDNSDSPKRSKDTREVGKQNNMLMNNVPSSFGINRDRSNTGDTEVSPTKDISIVEPEIQKSKLQDINDILLGFDATLRDREADEKRMLEWRLVAKVFDRLFLILFGVSFIISSMTLLSGCPNM